MSTAEKTTDSWVAKLKNVSVKLRQIINSRDIVLALLVAAILISVGAGLGWYNNRIIPTNPSPIAHYTGEPSNKLSYLSNWDGPDYIRLAQGGYRVESEANFFPLYPTLIRVVHYVLPSYIISALLVSWAALVAAIFFFIKATKILLGINTREEQLKSLLLFLLFPTGVFLFATYTESLLAALALGAIYFALNKRYLVGGLLTLFATATHITGIFVLLLIALILWEQKVKLLNILKFLIIGSVGLLSYMYYLDVKFSAPLAFVTAQKSHGWLAKGGYSDILSSVDLFNIFFIILLILSAFYWWNKRKSFSLYSLMFICIPLVGKQFGGFNRYVLMALPIPFMLYKWTSNKRPIFYSLLLALFAISWAYFLFQYAGGYVGG